MTNIAPRTKRKLQQSMKVTDRLRKQVQQVVRNPARLVRGLLKDDLDSPTEFGDEAKKQDVQLWVKREDKLVKTEDVIEVCNYIPGRDLSKGQYVVCMFMDGEWEIFDGSCSTFEDKLDDD